MALNRVILAIAPALVASHMNSVPAFFWSGNSLFQGQDATGLDRASASDIEGMLSAMMLQTPKTSEVVSKHVKSEAEAPELAVVFVHDKLRTDEVSRLGSDGVGSGVFDNLKAAMRSSTSSVSLPYAFYPEGEVSNSLASLMTQVDGEVVVAYEKGAATHALVKDASNAIPAEELVQFLANSPTLSSNGKTDVVVVVMQPVEHTASDYAAQLMAQDVLTGSIMEQVSAAENFAAAMVADAPTSSDLKMTFESTQRQGRRLSAQSGADEIPVTPDMLAGFMVGGLMLFIFYHGISCLLSLKTPLDFEKPGAEHQQ